MLVSSFLEQVEKYEKNKDNCTAGVAVNLGPGVVKHGIQRFKKQALVAVNRANLLTRIWMQYDKEPEILRSEYLFYSLVRNMVEGDPDIFAAGNCYDKYEFKDYHLFCPFSYRLRDGRIIVKDLSLEYQYLDSTSEFFFRAREKAYTIEEKMKQGNFSYLKGITKWRYNGTAHYPEEEDMIVTVSYEDGHWGKPYFDCGGGDIWMMTYTIPFFAFRNGTFYFKGTSGIDIDLQKVDIDQCPLPEGSSEPNVFADSARCKKATTRCELIAGLGFRRGSYRCVCKDSFYFPDEEAVHKYYNGTEIENEYEKWMRGDSNQYEVEGSFECLPCAPGCETCTDPRPCILDLDWVLRSSLLGVSVLIMCWIPMLVWFTVHYRDVKVLKAASPVLLRIILLGALFLYTPLIVSYFQASVPICCMRVWFREIGFAISYGALLLKTWRISVVFRVRSAQRVKISDYDLIKRLIIVVLLFAGFLTARMVAGRPKVVEGKHTSGLKTFQCSSDWWDHSAAIVELLFLLWGVRLCIVVRKAPSEFNESRFISWAIYNETVLAIFLNVSMVFLQHPFPSNPDLLYVVQFIHTQLTTGVTLAFLFGSKAYIVFKYRGREQPTHTTMVSSRGSRHKYSPTVLTTVTNSGNQATVGDRVDSPPEYDSVMEKDVQTIIQEEFRRLYTQLEVLKQRNMKIGNPHLQHKLSAMTEAARDDLPDSAPSSPNLNGKRVVINLDNFHEATSV
ncbi:LOW QUALITY PROTEIN: probable G-protein coupled receptor CG31760 [Liolophura sinensis]|uniref:LOW QUALITY PROTEIN: probable G-protein coupled receptor CG31760 n=1 Tax=Liolophura sinensis TaxID=3198878 RepID=UPI00315932A4